MGWRTWLQNPVCPWWCDSPFCCTSPLPLSLSRNEKEKGLTIMPSIIYTLTLILPSCSVHTCGGRHLGLILWMKSSHHPPPSMFQQDMAYFIQFCFLVFIKLRCWESRWTIAEIINHSCQTLREGDQNYLTDLQQTVTAALNFTFGKRFTFK